MGTTGECSLVCMCHNNRCLRNCHMPHFPVGRLTCWPVVKTNVHVQSHKAGRYIEFVCYINIFFVNSMEEGNNVYINIQSFDTSTKIEVDTQ